jgi:SAM-dependent methyltransferase
MIALNKKCMELTQNNSHNVYPSPINKDFPLSNFISNLLYLLLVILISILYFFYNSKRSNIRRWHKSLHLQDHEEIFQQIYGDANGYLLSQHARQKHNAMEYTYGEIKFLSFIALLSLTKPDENTVFYDLGSGIGKAVLACSMVFPVRKSVGVELFPELYFDACKRARLLASIKNYSTQEKKIEFILGDFLEVNFEDATLIFINSTAFFGPTWEKLCARLDLSLYLNTVITTSKALLCDNFSLIRRTQVEMSWGVVFAYIHTRKTKHTNRLEKIE